MKTLQIRNVSDDVHRRLKMRAACAGRSMSELALAAIVTSLEKPTRREWLETLATHEAIEIPPEEIVAALREGRESR